MILEATVSGGWYVNRHVGTTLLKARHFYLTVATSFGGMEAIQGQDKQVNGKEQGYLMGVTSGSTPWSRRKGHSLHNSSVVEGCLDVLSNTITLHPY